MVLSGKGHERASRMTGKSPLSWSGSWLHRRKHVKSIELDTWGLCTLSYALSQKGEKEGFPGGAVVESPPANAEDAGSSPGLGRSHMPRSNWAREPQLLSLRVWSLCSATREAVIMRDLRTAMKSGLHLPQLEKALTQKRRPNTAINK